MNNDFEEFIAKRCEAALMNNKEYNDMQQKALAALKEKNIEKYSECNVSLQCITQKLCYSSALKDFMLFLN